MINKLILAINKLILAINKLIFFKLVSHKLFSRKLTSRKLFSRKLTSCVSLSLFLFLLIFSKIAFAAFGVTCEPPADIYGNGQSAEFRKAMYGGAIVTPAEEEQLAALMPEPYNGVYYVRANINWGKMIFNQVQNRSVGIEANGTIVTKQYYYNVTGMEFAFGYLYSPGMRFELEYLANKDGLYIANPVLTNVPFPRQNFVANIQNNTLLINAYFEYDGWGWFKPYVVVGVGGSVDTISASVNPSVEPLYPSSKVTFMGYAWDAGLGFRISLRCGVWLDVHGRYIRIASGLHLRPNQSTQVMGALGQTAYGFGLIFFF